jgi:hypothetical protein
LNSREISPDRGRQEVRFVAVKSRLSLFAINSDAANTLAKEMTASKHQSFVAGDPNNGPAAVAGMSGQHVANSYRCMSVGFLEFRGLAQANGN